MTIYRWYPSKAAIALDAAQFMARTAPSPGTGSLKGDLLAVLNPTMAAMTYQGALFAGLMAEAQTDPVTGPAFREGFVSNRRAMMRRIFEDARARGEIAPDADINLLVDLVYGPLWYRLLNKHAILDGAFVEALTRAVLAAAKAVASPLARRERDDAS